MRLIYGFSRVVVVLGFLFASAPLIAMGPAPKSESEIFVHPYTVPTGKIPLFYRPEYNISLFGIEKFHPFDSKKFGRIYNNLVTDRVVSPHEVIAPPFVSDEVLRIVHPQRYLDSLRSARILKDILEISILSLIPAGLTAKQVLTPMRYATGGTLLAAQAALERGWAINLGGGYHHASSESGGGFCVFADITLAIRNLRENLRRPIRAMIVDFDAHQGNGHETDFLHDEKTFIVDAYNAEIYPEDENAKAGIDLAVELKSGIGDKEYLHKISLALKTATEQFEPEIVIYNAGTDIMMGDKLGKMAITPEGIIARDEAVFRWAKKNQYPIVMLLSGGYQKANAAVISRSIDRLFKTGLIRR